MFQLSSERVDPIMVSVHANNKDLTMELDTGAALSVISESTYLSTWSPTERPPLKPSNATLTTYSGESLEVCGAITIPVTYKQQSNQLSLQVLKKEGPSLLGRDWLKHLVLDWKQINFVRQQSNSALQKVLDSYPEVFRDELGSIEGVKVQLHLKQDAKPHYHRPRPVPYSLRSKVEDELQRLLDCGVTEPVHFSEWAAPIVPVLKRDKTVRICGDYRLTVNQETTPDSYPLPRVEDLFATLSGGESFTKLDLSNAYLQLHLDEDSKKLTTINTHKGLFRYNRLPFGVSSAPAVFQRTMENLFKNIAGVCVYLDDVLVTGKTADDHLKNLAEVLAKMQSVGIRLSKKKRHFMLPEVEYLGHKISSEGLHPSEKKVHALKNAPKPTNVSQLKSFLGLVNYYSKFLPNLSTTLAPLYKLLQKKSSWRWGSKEDKAFHTNFLPPLFSHTIPQISS